MKRNLTFEKLLWAWDFAGCIYIHTYIHIYVYIHGEGDGNPLQYSCLENSMDREAWQATVCGVARDEHNLVTKPHNLIPLVQPPF